MMRRRTTSNSTPTEHTWASTGFHEWVLSLPWVVERPYSVGTLGVRSFAVDCEPLGRRQMWLVTGLEHGEHLEALSVAVIVTRRMARSFEDVGWGRAVTQMPPQHVLVEVCDAVAAKTRTVETLVLSAYSDAMS